ncbi:phospholipid scramblase 2-like [Gigantopelta aegis]|uniref:phospholipid scramblase 2-like n=1 Tax=Gigantopelta aegis TaxID=1735272 RepID=UPI001B8885B6|nr:phospholipid scramblase 2-like [Gigantopelta aegis]
MSAVVTQPQAGAKGQEFAMMTAPPPTVVVPAGLPPGLAYLGAIEEVRVHQELELIEVLVGWEKNNRYKICNTSEQQFMYAKEDTDCCTRQVCGTARPFVMNITDNDGQNLIQLHRPFRCQGSMFWCCCLQEMEIHSPAGVPIATIKEIWTCWTPRYKVFDMNGTPLFTILGECCYCKCCSDVIFKVFHGEDESVETGQIIKHWGGCREVFGGANDFSLRFPSGMDVLTKAILLGATFLIDFNYFEYSRN